MARRRGKPGDYLITDDYLGFTTYGSRVQTDYWGNIGQRILQRNLQEIASPLDDPRPVDLYRGPQYEQTTACQFETLPQFIGTTNIPFLNNSAYVQAFDFDVGVGTAEIGCTFVVAMDSGNLPDNVWITGDGDFVVTEGGDYIEI